MIRPLRRAHRYVLLALALLLPVLLAVAVAWSVAPPAQHPWTLEDLR